MRKNIDDQLYFTTNGKSSSYPFLHGLQRSQDRARIRQRKAKVAASQKQVVERRALERGNRKRWRKAFRSVAAEMAEALEARIVMRDARRDEQESQAEAHRKARSEELLRKQKQGKARAVEVVRGRSPPPRPRRSRFPRNPWLLRRRRGAEGTGSASLTSA